MSPDSRSLPSCPHGLVAFCPDCPPGCIIIDPNVLAGALMARVKGRDRLFVVVERVKASGALDWYTYHLTRWGARRAVRAYLRSGEVKGWRP